MTPQQLKEEARERLLPIKYNIIEDVIKGNFKHGKLKAYFELEKLIDSLITKAYEEGKREGV